MNPEMNYEKRNYPSKIFFLLNLCQFLTGLCLVVFAFSDLKHPPIQCLMTPHFKAIETYCFIQSVFTVEGDYQKHQLYPGVGPLLDYRYEKISQKYYFWIPYLLTIQILLLGLPRFCWKSYGEDLAVKLTKDFNVFPDVSKMKPSVHYFVATLGYHKALAIKFLGCEILGVFILISNIIFTDWYLDGRFFNGIPKNIAAVFKDEDVDEISDKVFPKVTKCIFHLFGSSGSVVTKDALCVMARNLIAGRAYIVLFVVFVSCAAIGCLSLTWRLATYISPKIREYMLLKQTPKSSEVKDEIRFLMTHSDLGDWFLLLQFSSAVSNFRDWLELASSHLMETKQRTTWALQPGGSFESDTSVSYVMEETKY